LSKLQPQSDKDIQQGYNDDIRFVWLAWGETPPQAVLLRSWEQIVQVVSSKPVFFFDGKERRIVRDLSQMSWPVHPRAVNFLPSYKADVTFEIASYL
jgi:hypothetical protein